MLTKKDLLYSNDHEWLKAEGNQATIGISDYAQHSLGELVFIELPKVGAQIAAGSVLGVVESVKMASDVYSPVSGKVLSVNSALLDAPELINEQPYESWLVVLEMTDPSQLASLMDADSYQANYGQED